MATNLKGLDLNAWDERRLLVVGDLMLDEYLWGRVERISPEAPVQVVEVTSQTAMLGGAGNVVRNIKALGAQVSVAGVVGEDEAGQEVLGMLVKEGIDSAGVLAAKGRKTSRKSRVMAGHQQVLRIDRESRREISAQRGKEIVKATQARLADFDGLILSDYAKGTLTARLIRDLISLFRTAGKPVLVDPKGGNYKRYQGASLITPNQREALEALKIDCASPEKAASLAQEALARYDWPALMITRGSQGMSLFRRDKPPVHIPAQARQVFDVSGAGDTVAAVAGLGLACGWPLVDVAALANLGGGVVVGKLGTAALTHSELRGAVFSDEESKIVDQADLLSAVGRLRASGKRIVFTNGCFDLLHVGHIHFLKRSREEGDVLIVALDDDKSVARLKGPSRPVIGQAERARIIAALDCVDLVTVFETDGLDDLLASLKPDVLTKGGNYTDEQVVGRRIVEASGGRVVLIPLKGETTTSGLLDRINFQGR